MGDGRYQIDGNSATVTSSSGGKAYTVSYDPDNQAIMANDNGSYWQGYLGYPAVVYLLAAHIVPYQAHLATYLAGFAWKNINQQFKNNFDQTQEYIDGLVEARHGVNLDDFHRQITSVQAAVNQLGLVHDGPRVKPPSGY